MNGKFNVFPLVMLFTAVAVSAAETGGGRYARDLVGAEFSVMTSIMVKTSNKSRYLCAENQYACVGVDRAELGLGLIANSRHDDLATKLFGLVKYRLDAGLSNDFKCYLNLRREDVLAVIKNFNPQTAARSCVVNFEQAQKKMKGKFDLSASQVCRSEVEIKQQMLEIKKQLKVGGSCDG